MRRVRLLWLGVTAGALLLGAAEAPLGLDAYMPAPEENPLTEAKVRLGRELFFDQRLSRDRSLSCASCHEPELGFTDAEPVGVGVGGKRGTRRTPRLINRGYGRAFFWDGREAELEGQVVKPIENPVEMDLPLEEAVARLDGDYPALFEEAFGRGPNAETLAWALASYVRTIVSGDSPYDRYLAGDRDALTAEQRRGLEVFRGDGGCGLCHLGPSLTDEEFHNTGVGWADGEAVDLGRGGVSGNEREQGAFKTPTLREVARTGPYMHDGSLETLMDVVEFYDEGGEENPYLDADMEELGLSEQQKKDLVAFLEALNGTIQEGQIFD